jgi:tRNA pseudouridine38-40 synthase
MEPHPIRYKLILAYDGTAYAGWQFQKTGTGVQEKVEQALGRLLGVSPRLHSSSRTDAGVHALAMVAHVDVPARRVPLPARKLALALNAHLPADIRVVSAVRTAPDFHARFWAQGKEYRYCVWNHRFMNPLLRHQAWHVPAPLDLQAMRDAAAELLGRHDFRSFAANRSYRAEQTVRELTQCSVRRQGSLLTFRLRADGFLYKMCRGIVGTLVQVGQGKINQAGLRAILDCCDRRAAGMTAPAHGLVLWKVFYPAGGRRVASAGQRNCGSDSDE